MKRTKASILVILVVALLIGLSAGSQQGGVSEQIRIEVLTEEGFQPLDYSIVGTVVPTIRISGPLPEGYRVFNDRPDGRAGVDGGAEGLGREITDSFEETSPGVVEGTLAFLYGANDVIVTDAAEVPEVFASAQMLNYTLEFEDVNGNGILDTGEDSNHNGILDPGEDANGNGTLEIDEDFNRNGILDRGEDLNGNELLDFNEDINGNRALTVNEDFNADGVLQPTEDFDADGKMSPFILDAGSLSLGQDRFPASDDGTGAVYSDRALLLDFVDDASDVVISNYLRNKGLRPAVLLVNNAITTKPKVVAVELPVGSTAMDLARQLNGLSESEAAFFPPIESLPVDPPLEVAALLSSTERPDVAGEALPTRLINGAPVPGGNAGRGYDNARAGFDNSGDVSLSPWDDDNDGLIDEDPLGDANGDGAPGIVSVDDDGDGFIDEGSVNDDDEDGWIDEDPVNWSFCDELDIFWHHFFMDTFAAHRLIDTLVSGIANPRRPVIAQIDSGLGGLNAAGNYIPPTDIPMARIVNPMDCTQSPSLAVPVNRIPDTANHGNAVAHLLLGQGQRVLGVGKDVMLRPMFGGRFSISINDRRGVVTATTDPSVRVILIESQLRNVDLQTPALALTIQQLNNDNVAWRDALDAVLRPQNDKIVVIPAGNWNIDTDYTLLGGPTNTPQGQLRGFFDTPPRGTRNAGQANSLIMGISNASVENPPLGRELRFESSNFGSRISVAAPGDGVPSLLPNQDYTWFGGTSGAAPEVAGLAGELIFLDDNSANVGPFTPLQIVELIEATADDLGTTQNAPTFVNDAAGDGPDDHFGFGRINAWKAVLSAVNGGLAAESHPEPKAEAFSSLNRVSEAETKWYGFKIITSVKGATVWIDGKQLLESAPILPNPFPGKGETQTASRQINAYAGVRSDQVILIGVDDDHDGEPPGDIRLDEDPTSGVVPVGNDGGEYIMTFSITRDDLLDPGPYGTGRTLSLRRPRQTVTAAPFFNLRINTNEITRIRKGLFPGVTFDDFVFEITPTDHGDASPGYPVTYVPTKGGASPNGACHLNTNLEWFGKPNRPNVQSVSPEKDAIAVEDPDGFFNIDRGADLDRYDDGVVFYPLTYLPGGKGIVDFTVCVADPVSGRYGRDSDRSLFVNAWIDWNTNKTWEENEEHIINGFEITPEAPGWLTVLKPVVPLPATAITEIASSPTTKPGWATYRAVFNIPPTIGSGELWARFRIDYGENVGRNDPRPRFRSDPSLRDPKLPQTASQVAGAGRGYTKGAARFGEVEDYRIGSDFGDAPDKGAGWYPTRMSSAGARHLDIYKEWLQDSKTREPDACLEGNAVSADQDGHPNLGDDCDSKDLDLAEEAKVSYDQGARELRVSFTVHSDIFARGYDLMPVDPNPFSEKNEIKVSTMNPANCCTQIKLPVWATPRWSGGKGRYHATEIDDDRDRKLNEDKIDGADNDKDGLIDEDPPGIKPLFANIFVDWNGDRVWDTSDNSLEWVLKDGLIAPETFGEDGKYTLGEPFYDLNHDGVRQDGEDFVDSAGKSEQRYECVFAAPEDVAQRFWVRIRLTYAELSNGTIPTAVAVPSVVPSPLSSMLVPFIVPGVSSEKLVEAGIAHSTEDKRAMDKEKGGALFGEVEDYPVRTISVTKKPDVIEVPPGGEIDYTISLKNPSENAVEGITLVDELPDAVSFKSMVKAPSGITYNSASHTVEGTLDLLPLAEIEITYITEVPETIPPYTLIANCVTIETPTYTAKICPPEVTITEPEVEPCDTALLVEPVESMVEVLLTMKTKLESILRDLDRKKLSGSKLRSEFRRVPYNKFKEIMDTCREPLELCVPEFSQKLEELDKAEKKADSVCHKERKTTCPVRVTEKASEPIELCLGAVIAMILLLNSFLK